MSSASSVDFAARCSGATFASSMASSPRPIMPVGSCQQIIRSLRRPIRPDARRWRRNSVSAVAGKSPKAHGLVVLARKRGRRRRRPRAGRPRSQVPGLTQLQFGTDALGRPVHRRHGEAPLPLLASCRRRNGPPPRYSTRFAKACATSAISTARTSGSTTASLPGTPADCRRWLGN
jgi:hypothetical protein